MAKSSYSGSLSVIYAPVSHHTPLTPAKAGVQGQELGPRFRGDERIASTLSRLAFPDPLMDRQHLLRAQYHRHVDHLAVDRDRAAARRNRLVVRRDTLARGGDIIGGRGELFVQDRNLRGVNHRGAAEAEPA